jgi:transposase
MRNYSSDVTDSQWEVIKHFVNYSGCDQPQRKREHDSAVTSRIREVVNAIFYLVKTGCQWRQIPVGFPPWTVSGWSLRFRYYYDRWRRKGLIESRSRLYRMLDRLRGMARRKAGRKTSPSAGAIDCQSVKTSKAPGLGAIGW